MDSLSDIVGYVWDAWRSQLSFQMVPSVFTSHTFPWLFYFSLHSFYISVPPRSFFPSYIAFSFPLFLLTLLAAGTAQADPNIFCVSPPGMRSLRPKSWGGWTRRTRASQYSHLLVITSALVGLDSSNRTPDPQCPWSLFTTCLIISTSWPLLRVSLNIYVTISCIK